jgi:hypothetical protein
MASLTKWVWMHRRSVHRTYPIGPELPAVRSILDLLGTGEAVPVAPDTTLVGSWSASEGGGGVEVRVRWRRRFGLKARRAIYERRQLAVRCRISQSDGTVLFEGSVDFRSRTIPFIGFSIFLLCYLVVCSALLIAGVLPFHSDVIEPLVIVVFVLAVLLYSRSGDLRMAMRDESKIERWRADLLRG